MCSAIDKWTSEKELQEGAKYHANCYMKFVAASLKSLYLIFFIEDAQMEDATQFSPENRRRFRQILVLKIEDGMF